MRATQANKVSQSLRTPPGAQSFALSLGMSTNVDTAVQTDVREVSQDLCSPPQYRVNHGQYW